MKICIEATPIGIRGNDKGGVYRYLRTLIETLGRIDPANRYTLFFNMFRPGHISFLKETLGTLEPGRNFSVKVSRFPNALQRFVEPPAELLAGPFDVFHGCFDYLRPVSKGKGVVTIHDLRYLEKEDPARLASSGPSLSRMPLLPSPRSSEARDYRSGARLHARLRRSIEDTCRRADIIITVSKFSAGNIARTLGVPPGKIRVIPHGVDSRFRPRTDEEIRDTLRSIGVRKPYVLYAGKFDPNKNVSGLLEAFRGVVRETDAHLVLAGPPNWNEPSLKAQAEASGIAGMVRFTGYVSDDELARLYGGASAFAFPSFYEGFGLPLLEAMASGVPVVTSRLCSIPEIVGDAAVFVDPASPGDIRDGILRCLTDRTLRERLSGAGLERARHFTWERTARQTLSAYVEAYESG